MRPVSPIVSPPRASRDSAFDNDSASLPSYRSSATRQSEKYSTLMRYLDGVADGSSGVDASASLSTISASPAPSMAGSAVTAKSRRQFVWDEDPEAMPIHAGPIDSSLSVTYFSLHEDGPGSAAGSLESKVADVKAKVQGMKAELRQRNDLAKQLQSDFARVKAAKERQDQKSREAADKRLGEVRAGHQDSIRQQQALVDKIQKDVKALEEKEAKLLAKLDKLRGDMDASVEAARADVRRGRRREVQQWEADEARSTAKLVASRVDAMHKSAAQALAPELERIVAEGRDALSRREAEADAARRVLAESLRAEGDKKFGEFQKLCRERYSGADGDRRGGLVAETRLQEARSRHEGERVAVIEQFQRERRLVDDEMERSRQVLNDNHGLLLKSIQDAHVQKVNEMTSSHGRERSLLMEQLVADRESLSKELDRDRGKLV